MYGLNELAAEARRINEANGWTQPAESPSEQIALLALIFTEGSEAIEEVRDGHAMDHVYYSAEGYPELTPEDARDMMTLTDIEPKPEGVPSELADVVIRCADIAARFGIDLDAAVVAKLKYNATRGHHHGGKTL